ncbi:MAG: hypothetical protein AB7V18_19340 [Pyrinomonadaceae bacterium]
MMTSILSTPSITPRWSLESVVKDYKLLGYLACYDLRFIKNVLCPEGIPLRNAPVYLIEERIEDL